MKIRIILLPLLITLLLAIFFISSLHAEKPDLHYALDVKQKIMESFRLPTDGFLTTEKFIVTVTFCINKKGRIRVSEVSTDNAEVKRYIRQEMRCICCKHIKQGCNKKYRITINYDGSRKNNQGRTDLNSS